MQRRDLLKSAALLATFAPTFSTGQLFEKQEYHPPPSTGDRLDQGPFAIDQDHAWLTILFTTPSEKPQRNPGLGLVGYASESGPSLATRAGKETLEPHVENISSLPFVDARGMMNQGCAIRWSWR